MVTWDAIVLAGGRGQRLGGIDKGQVEVRGQTLLARAVEAVAGADRIIVVGDVEVPGAIVVQESPRYGGPAAAIGAGLVEVNAPYVVVIACDQPFVAEAVTALVGQVEGEGVIAIDTEGQLQTLTACVHTKRLREAAESMGSLENRSARDLLGALDLRPVAVPSDAILDVDTWDDHARAEATD